MKLNTKKVRSLLKILIRILFHGRYDKYRFIVFDNSELIFIPIAKNASSSIHAALFHYPENITSQQEVHKMEELLTKNSLSKNQKKYTIFAYTRNPYERLVSCYEDKINNKRQDFLYKDYFFGFLHQELSFEDFVNRISLIPHWLADRHFAPQYDLLFNKHTRTSNLLIYDINTLPESFVPFATKGGFSNVSTYNKNPQQKDWKKYYTDEIAEVVFNMYKNDFEYLKYDRYAYKK